MTDLLYQRDAYLREFAATVTAVDAARTAVALDRSAFYPTGGGQPSDLGVLLVDGRTLEVTGVRPATDEEIADERARWGH